MRPDRFGQSPGREFMESSGREREHAYEGGVSFPGLSVGLTLHGFSVPNLPGFLGFPRINAYELYRKCHFIDPLFDLRSFYREGRAEMVHSILRPYQFGFTPEFTNSEWIAREKIQWFGSLNQTELFLWNRISGNMGIVSHSSTEVSFLGTGGNPIRTLSQPINVKAWIRFVGKFLEQLSEFPTGGVLSYTLVPAPGTIAPDEPPEDAFHLERDQWTNEIGQTRDIYSALGYYLIPDGATGEIPYARFTFAPDHYQTSSQFGMWPFSDGTPSGFEKAKLPFMSVGFRLHKTLVPLFDKPASVKYWLVEKGNTPFEQLSCTTGSPAEVIIPIFEPLDRLDTETKISEPSGLESRHYMFPGSGVPDFSYIKPSCAPNYE